MSESPSKLYLLRRREEWELARTDDGYYRHPKNGGAVRAFASRKRAEAFRLRLERRRRERLTRANPFVLCRHAFGSDYLTPVTSLPEFALLDWLREVGLAPPVAPAHRELWYDDWVKWWRKTVRTMTPDQLAHTWSGLDCAAFYEVVELELE